MSEIFKIISDEINEFNQEEVTIVDKFTFRQRDTIEKIIRTYNSKFVGSEYDSEGFRKYFKNIVRNPCNSATKAIKITPKDIMVVPTPGHSSLTSWIMERDLRHYMKETGFNRFLNNLFREIPKFGSVVIKIVNGKLHFVDLRNLINEQSADTLKDSAYVIEQHYYSPYELRKKNWDNIEEAIQQWRDSKMPYIKVIERYGEVPASEFGGNTDEYVYARYIVAVPEAKIGDRLQMRSSGVILDKTKISLDEFPYREFHWEKIPGRWLGVGRVELLFDPQIRTNEITNLRVKSSYVAALNIWQSADDNVKKNLIKDIATGQVITAMDRIERIPTEDRNLASFSDEERGWMGNRDEVTFNYDVIRGERMPAGTPLGSAQMAAEMIASYFMHIKEDIAAGLKEMIEKDIIPQFKKTGEHYLKLVGEDLDKWNELMIIEKTNSELLRMIGTGLKIPTQAQKEAIKKVISERQKKSGEDAFIPLDFYKDLLYKIDIVITGQDRDLRVQSANMAMALQTMIADPTVLTDPAKRKVFGKQLEAVGINIHDIAPSEEAEQGMEQMVQEQKGGGISAPSFPQNVTPSL